MSGKVATTEHVEKECEPTGNGGQGNSEFPGCLDGWKDIAAYLRRDVRTVQRWEKSLGLPVQRVQDSKSGSVYAFRSEIDAWRRERGRKTSYERLSVVPPPVKAAEQITAEGTPRVHRSLLIALVAGLLLGIACSQFVTYIFQGTALAHSADGSVHARGAAASANRTAFAPPSSTRQD